MFGSYNLSHYLFLANLVIDHTASGRTLTTIVAASSDANTMAIRVRYLYHGFGNFHLPHKLALDRTTPSVVRHPTNKSTMILIGLRDQRRPFSTAQTSQDSRLFTLALNRSERSPPVRALRCSPIPLSGFGFRTPRGI